MEALDYWRLCDELSVIQAALLIVEHNPSESQTYIDSWEAHHKPKGYDATLAALKHAIIAKRLPAELRYKATYEHYFYENTESVGDWERSSDPDWHLTTVHVDNLKTWLLSRGVKTGFFFPEHITEINYLNPRNENYAPKLAAAVKSWQAVTSDEELLNGKTPKQALDKWLRENASQFELTDDKGNPNKEGISQISKVANWKPEGGAAKTPGNNQNLSTPQKRGKP